MVLIINVCIWQQTSKKNVNTDVKCEQGLMFTQWYNHTGFFSFSPWPSQRNHTHKIILHPPNQRHTPCPQDGHCRGYTCYCNALLLQRLFCLHLSRGGSASLHIGIWPHPLDQVPLRTRYPPDQATHRHTVNTMTDRQVYKHYLSIGSFISQNEMGGFNNVLVSLDNSGNIIQWQPLSCEHGHLTSSEIVSVQKKNWTEQNRKKISNPLWNGLSFSAAIFIT